MIERDLLKDMSSNLYNFVNYIPKNDAGIERLSVSDSQLRMLVRSGIQIVCHNEESRCYQLKTRSFGCATIIDLGEVSEEDFDQLFLDLDKYTDINTLQTFDTCVANVYHLDSRAQEIRQKCDELNSEIKEFYSTIGITPKSNFKLSSHFERTICIRFSDDPYIREFPKTIRKIVSWYWKNQDEIETLLNQYFPL